ncbi:hypothetical protein ACFSTE_12160 [Aquimarina hainanensis]|uniref:Uncharacterized protein n=1 Tax=Aquimarina hainanensis TaxID=1578017 RepID=A0ABW5N957_9FLAO
MKNFIRFKKVSIRGRLAYALECITIYLNNKDIVLTKEIQEQLDLFWSINTSKVDIYNLELKLKEMSPSSILNDTYEGNFNMLSHQDYLNLKYFYSKQNDDTLRLFFFLSELVFSNLYVDTGSYGEGSFNYFMRFIEICEKNKIDFPDRSGIMSSKFKHNYGWGNIQDINFWKS